MAQISIGPGSFTGAAATVRVLLELIVTSQQLGEAVDINLDELFNAYSVFTIEQKDLTLGFTAHAVPPAAATNKAGGVILRPPDGNAETITLKGVTGDTGIALSKVGWTLLTFATAPPATIGLTTGAAIAGFRFIWF